MGAVNILGISACYHDSAVCTPEHAWLCFVRTNMDYLLLGNFLLEKTAQKALDKDIDWLKGFELD
jgi:carbamoyltransferase